MMFVFEFEVGVNSRRVEANTRPRRNLASIPNMMYLWREFN